MATEGNKQKKQLDKQNYAFMLYLSGVSQKEISERVDVSPQTLVAWKHKGSWEQKRASKNLSVESLISRVLLKANEELDKPDFSADKLSKIIAQLKTLKQGASPDDLINIFTEFGDWVIAQKELNKAITSEFIKTLISLQDSFILIKLKNE